MHSQTCAPSLSLTFPPASLNCSALTLAEFCRVNSDHPVHWNASFESPPSSFLLSTPAVHIRWHAGADKHGQTATDRWFLTHKGRGGVFVFCFFFLEWTDRSWWKLDKLSGSGRRCERGCMLKGVGYVRVLEFTAQNDFRSQHKTVACDSVAPCNYQL